jgi:hypothetical protein
MRSRPASRRTPPTLAPFAALPSPTGFVSFFSFCFVLLFFWGSAFRGPRFSQFRGPETEFFLYRAWTEKKVKKTKKKPKGPKAKSKSFEKK